MRVPLLLRLSRMLVVQGRVGEQRRSFDGRRLFHLPMELTSGEEGDRPFPAVFGVLTRWAASGG